MFPGLLECLLSDDLSDGNLRNGDTMSPQGRCSPGRTNQTQLYHVAPIKQQMYLHNRNVKELYYNREFMSTPAAPVPAIVKSL